MDFTVIHESSFKAGLLTDSRRYARQVRPFPPAMCCRQWFAADPN